MESAPDDQLRAMRGVIFQGGDRIAYRKWPGRKRKEDRGTVLFTITNGPLHCVQGSLLHGVTNDSAVVEFNECVGDGQRQGSLLSHFLHANQNLAVRTVARLIGMRQYIQNTGVPYAGNPLQNKMSGRDRARLIKTADIDPPCERDPERFRAKDC